MCRRLTLRIQTVAVLEAAHHPRHLLVLNVAHGLTLKKHCNLNVQLLPLWMMLDRIQYQVVPIISDLPLMLTHFNQIRLLIKLLLFHHKTIMLMFQMFHPEICTKKVILQLCWKQLVCIFHSKFYVSFRG